LATTKVEICNSALVKIGAEFINDFSDDSTEARLCNLRYDFIRRKVLRGHPWNFALKRVQLAKIAAVPLYQFESQFILPQDVLRVIELADASDLVDWVVEGRVLLANQSTAKIKYIANITDTSQFDAHFDEVIAWELAWDLVYKITESISLRQQLRDDLKDEKPRAMSFDAQEGQLQSVESNEWIDARV